MRGIYGFRPMMAIVFSDVNDFQSKLPYKRSMQTNDAARRASHLDFAESVVDSLLEELPAGDPSRRTVAQQAAIVLMADYLQGMPGARFMSPLRTFSSLDHDTCENLGSMIYTAFAEAKYCPPVSADDGRREDTLTNSLLGLRAGLRHAALDDGLSH